MSTQSSTFSHCPVTRLWLEQAGQVFFLRQVAPEWVLPAASEQLHAGPAVVVVEIDGRRHDRTVTIVTGQADEHGFVHLRAHASSKAAG